MLLLKHGEVSIEHGKEGGANGDKVRGVELGSPENFPPDAGKRGAGSKIRSAQDAYRPVYNYIRMMRRDRMSYDHIAARLNDDGHTTRQRRPFQAMTVYRIVQRNGSE